MTTDKSPVSPAEWVMRVRDLREKKDLENSLKECRNGLEKFPSSTDLLFMYGELRVRSFNKTKKTEHLKKALSSFETLLKINPAHYMANLLTAQIYFKAHAYDRAEQKVTAILKSSPADPGAMKIRKALQKRTREGVETKVDESDGITTEKLEGLQEGKSAEYAGLIKRLPVFNKLKGFLSAHLIDSCGLAVKHISGSSDKNDSIASVATDIFRTSGLSSRKVNMGNFQKGQVITPEGIIIMANVFYAILVVVVEPQSNLNEVNEMVDKYVEELAG